MSKIGSGKQVAKKMNIGPPSHIIDFFCNQHPHNKEGPTQHAFLEDAMLYVATSYQPMSFVENVWLRWLILCECVQFPYQHQRVIEVFPNMSGLGYLTNSSLGSRVPKP